MKLNVVQVLKHLPKPNCKECGEPTCMVFASKLLKNEKQLEECKPLFSSEYADRLQALQTLLTQLAAQRLSEN